MSSAFRRCAASCADDTSRSSSCTVSSATSARASDSELVIGLINEAQIFRFLNRPVKVNLLKDQLHAALQRYLTYKQTPELLKAHRVKPATEEHTLSLRARILENLKKLRARWF